MSNPSESLIFLHVPKTAGTTLNRLIEWEYNPTRIFTVDGTLVPLSLWRFRHLGESRRRRLEVVKGHMFYGLHELLPQPSTYITVLRDPVERLLSTYYYIRSNRIHPFHRRAMERSLREFVETEPSRSNLQCKLLAGVGPFAPCDDETLALASRHLAESFSVVGLTERFEESLVLMKRRFGWNLHHYASYRRTTRKPARDRIASETLDAIAEVNRFDIALYELGRKRFEEQIAALGPEFESEVRSLRDASGPNAATGLRFKVETAGRTALTKICSTF